MNLRRLRLTNIQSLVDCNLNFWIRIYIQYGVEDYEAHRNVLRELLDRLGHVKKLTMGNWGIQVGFSCYLCFYVCIQKTACWNILFVLVLKQAAL